MTDQSPSHRLAIVNARVWTGDVRRPWADAVLVRGDVIETVGSSAEVKKRAGADAVVIDARGKLVAPADDGEALPGMLRAGEQANLVVVDAEPPRVTAESLRDAKVVLRMTRGRVMHDINGLVPSRSDHHP